MAVYTFDKSLRERLTEFTEILSNRSNIVPASRIKSEWSFYVELAIEPTGWRAIWKIPRLTCHEYEIHYPTIVLVEVENVNCEELMALARIVGVQDDIRLPEKCDVPLTELYLTIHQENAVLDTVGTAACIDRLRFFYRHLWMPWDADDDDDADWVARHLESRIRLYYDIKRDEVDEKTADIVRTLIREGKEIETRIERLEADMTDEDDEDGENNDENRRDEKDAGANVDTTINEGKACQLMKLHLQLRGIKSEMEVLENPTMRDVIRRSGGVVAGFNDGRTKRNDGGTRMREGYFVWDGGFLRDARRSLDLAARFMSDDLFLKVSGCLREALERSKTGDTVAVGEGEHRVRGAGGLEEGGILRGIGNVEAIAIRPEEIRSGPTLFDLSGGEILLENLSLDVDELQAGVLVRRGFVKIIDCRIFVSGKSVVKSGVVVLAGGKLLIENTTFLGLGTAIVVHPAGEAILDRCQFQNCVDGIQLHDGARVVVTKCHLSGFEEFGIRMETDKYLPGNDGKTGGEELLDGIEEITVSDCSFGNNGRANVALKPSLVATFATRQGQHFSGL